MVAYSVIWFCACGTWVGCTGNLNSPGGLWICMQWSCSFKQTDMRNKLSSWLEALLRPRTRSSAIKLCTYSSFGLVRLHITSCPAACKIIASPPKLGIHILNSLYKCRGYHSTKIIYIYPGTADTRYHFNTPHHLIKLRIQNVATDFQCVYFKFSIDLGLLFSSCSKKNFP